MLVALCDTKVVPPLGFFALRLAIASMMAFSAADTFSGLSKKALVSAQNSLVAVVGGLRPVREPVAFLGGRTARCASNRRC